MRGIKPEPENLMNHNNPEGNDLQIISRKEAVNLGIPRYFTGRKCKYGHISPRKVHSHACCECARLLTNKSRHPELNGEAPERNCRRGNGGIRQVSSYTIDMFSTGREYEEKYKPSDSAKQNKRRSLKLRSGGNHDALDVIKIGSDQGWLCANPFCKKDVSELYHVDHVIPLSKGGSNGCENIQILCPECNL